MVFPGRAISAFTFTPTTGVNYNGAILLGMVVK